MASKVKKSSSKTISFRVSEDDYKLLEQLKNSQKGNKKYSMSTYIKDCIFHDSLNEKIEVIKIKTVYRDRHCQDESLKIYHLNRIGNNLNQITKNININKSVDIKVLTQLEEISDILKGLI